MTGNRQLSLMIYFRLQASKGAWARKLLRTIDWPLILWPNDLLVAIKLLSRPHKGTLKQPSADKAHNSGALQAAPLCISKRGRMITGTRSRITTVKSTIWSWKRQPRRSWKTSKISETSLLTKSMPKKQAMIIKMKKIENLWIGNWV